jgi:hypothetical protein
MPGDQEALADAQFKRDLQNWTGLSFDKNTLLARDSGAGNSCTKQQRRY